MLIIDKKYDKIKKTKIGGKVMKKTLVIDIGGTFIKYGLINDELEITCKDKVKTEYGLKEKFFASLFTIIDQFSEEIDGVAISSPGLIDTDKGIMVTAGMMRYLDGTHLVDELKQNYPSLKFSVENDGKCAALCESWVGAAKDVDSTVVLIFGSGIGGGVILDNKLLKGRQLIAGEFSPMFTRFDADDYTYLAEETSTFSIVKKAKEIKKNDQLMGEELIKLYQKEDSEIKPLVDNWFLSVAKMCYNMDCLYNPDCICIGGGISENPVFIQGIEKALDIVREKAYTFRKPVVKKCQYNNDSNLIGAYYAYKNKK